MRVLSIALLFALISCQDSEKVIVPITLTNNPLLSRIDSTIQRAFSAHVEKLDCPGISIGILKNGKTSFYGYGETALGNGVIPNENTFFEIGSITKTFTAIAITEMLLNEQKAIETPIKSYLPSDLPTLQRGGTEVNFKHILTHTAGIPRIPNNLHAYEKYDNERLYQYLNNVQLEAVPYTRHVYSNTGFAILGNILERHYKTGYSELIADRLLTPLRLNDTKADFEDTDVNRWAKGYKGGKETMYWKSMNAFNGAGVLKSTAKDLLLYAQANLSPPDNTLGKAIRLTHQVAFADAQGDEGLSWVLAPVRKNSDKHILWHNGGTGGFNSWLYINEENKSALVILFNSYTETSQRSEFISELISILTD